MKQLQAGAVSAGYENGFLRRISYGGKEILRMIYFALRDHNWNTIPGHIENENIVVDDVRFQITYDYLNVYGGATLMEWKSVIEGRGDGTIVFEIRGVARQSFKRNRAGFCVLHPLNVAGVACSTVHADGASDTHPFPVNVAAKNPFRDMVSMSWRSADIPYELIFEGDTFETEDQRNWGDASYKTFCTPLHKPFPVELKPGEKVFQRVTFRPRTALRPVDNAEDFVSLHQGAVSSAFPLLGIAASTEYPRLTDDAVSMIKALNLKHYRVEVYPSGKDWVSDFSRGCENAFDMGLPLEVALHLTEAYKEEIEAFSVLCLQNKVKLKKVLLLAENGMVTSQASIDNVIALKDSLPRVLIGAGTNYNFNEINNNHFSPGAVDYISFSVDPQEHAFDDITILENGETPEYLIRSAKAIYGESMPIHISPITLRKRFNPYATDPAGLFIPEAEKTDARQMQDLAAVWTFCVLRSVTRGKGSAVTLFQTAGNQGILSGDGNPYPVYKAIKNFSGWQGKLVHILDSSDSLQVQGMMLDEKILAVVNLTQQGRKARFGSREFLLRPLEMRFETLDRT